LIEYESPLPTVVRDVNGEPFQSYARERRVQLEYADFPRLLIRAYLAAEDKTFFSHGGIDYPGIASAVFDNIFTSGRSRGASTITQQVAKNLLLTNEYSYTRKVKEAILAKRIENALTKPQILSLYLNEIALGRQSFGVEAAAQAYFGKSVDQLQLHEMAFLAILPKAPERYGRAKNAEAAIVRRNWVLGEMFANGWITEKQMAEARAMPLGLIAQRGTGYKNIGGYFTEEVRRQLIEKFGETDKDGPYSVYAGGLWVRTSMNPEFQVAATQALRDGLLRYNAGKAWKANMGTIDVSDDKWASRFASTNISIDYANWRAGVPWQGSGRFCRWYRWSSERRSCRDEGRRRNRRCSEVATAVRSVPKWAAAWWFRTRSMAGCSPFRVADNRISLQTGNTGTTSARVDHQALLLYATALDNGMTPTSIIVDGPYCVWQGAHRSARNASATRWRRAGPQTMRWGLEQSRNLMTVPRRSGSGMDNVTDTFRAMGLATTRLSVLRFGRGDTTVLKMVNAYSMLVNQGRELKPTLIDFAQNRKGKVIFPENWKPCNRCRAKDWDGKPMPRFAASGKQVMDPITAYQTVHMLEGVIQRGTATILRDLDRPLFGKTGTTTGPTNVWFIGGSPQLVAGLYLGFDQPRNMGGYAQGGSLAAPVFKQFARAAMADMPKTPFIAPAGTRLVRIDRKSGKRVYGAWPGDDPKSAVIWEAFKAETEPKRSIRQDELAARGDKPKKKDSSDSKSGSSNANAGQGPSSATKRDQEFIQQEGGILLITAPTQRMS
jgi:penicillin-binding protein 1A